MDLLFQKLGKLLTRTSLLVFLLFVSSGACSGKRLMQSIVIFLYLPYSILLRWGVLLCGFDGLVKP